ncbi:MAG TPA: RNA-guided endonuclease TnpB family protein [Candidatus Bathyarchaeia archaeon]|nr:RNA-guided endonuclease TnpB family protein [Candidatus Bathyarchaeia archaeon]
MKILRAYKTELDLNNTQKTACARHAGAARWAYNWGLARKMEAYQNGEKVLTAIDLHRELNLLKQSELSWMYAVSKCAPQEALRNLDQAYAHFFRRVKEKKAGRKVRVGYPKFKSKKNGLGGFRLTGAIHIFENAIQLPRLGRLRLKECGYLPVEDVHILGVTVSERAGRWFVSVQIERDIPDPKPTYKPVAGVDLGILALATVSDGTRIENPRAFKSRLRKIKRLQRGVSRRKKGSANREKAVRRLARAHLRVANVRKNALHQVTSRLARTKSAVVLENLNVSGMVKNHHLAQAIMDVGFYEFRRQMLYKGHWYGCQFILADPFYPSSKRCSQCGHIQVEMGLSERVYICDHCGWKVDRDLNAAINLEQLATGSSPERYACGESVSPGYQAVLVEAGTEQQSTCV